jgi:hypothetical protein
VTDEAENVPENSSDAIDSAWRTFAHAKQKRHDLQRLLFAQRVAEGMDSRITEALGAKNQ